ncbi:hypothetical protein [Streptomyces longwoodensis]|uniref:hypothetical protein n=1 Tax=Streptomyces longwoodensis TaxID=68231 RepID=UPI0033CC8270
MPVPFTAADTTRLRDTLDQVVADGATPGGVIAYGTTGHSPAFLTVGKVAPECGDTEPDQDTVYDIASLTKVVATWPLMGSSQGEPKSRHQWILKVERR